jgi:hypothetical protein
MRILAAAFLEDVKMVECVEHVFGASKPMVRMPWLH